MRELTSHKVTGLNEALTISVMDEPGPGGACHDYAITFFDKRYGCERSPIAERHGRNCIISFQKGPIQEAGVNGISIEALLAVVEDRLVGFQSGEFSCLPNGAALEAVRMAMRCLALRTKDRLERGVEGKNEK